MKSLLYWKLADIILQVLALLVPVVLCITDVPFDIFYSYFSVGAAQVVSCVINKLFLDPDYRADGRRTYEITLLLVLGLFLLLWVGYLVWNDIVGVYGIFAVAMLFIGPIMAIAYVLTTLTELITIKKRYKYSQDI